MSEESNDRHFDASRVGVGKRTVGRLDQLKVAARARESSVEETRPEGREEIAEHSRRSRGDPVDPESADECDGPG